MPIMDVSQLSNSAVWNVLRLAVMSLNLFALVALQLPISLSNCWLQLHSSLIHPNLRFVLLIQSLSFCTFGVARIVQIWTVFTQGPEHFLDGKVLQTTMMLTIGYMNSVGHVLLVERLLASYMYRKYEHFRGPLFSLAWFSLLVCALFSHLNCNANPNKQSIYSGYNAYQQVFQSDNPNDVLKITPAMLASGIIWTGLALGEILISSLIGAHNLREYRKQLRVQGRHNLSERFQMSENIRTARQLAPAFALHFVNVLSSALFPILVYFELLSGPILMEMWSEVGFMLQAFFNFLIEFTIISRHPILRRNALQMLQRIRPAPAMLASGNRVDAARTMTMDGLRNNGNQMMDQYFEILRQDWGDLGRL